MVRLITPRAYLLVDIADDNYHQVEQTLESEPGVNRVHLIEGPPDNLVRVEARNHQKLAEITVSALASEENLAENTPLLPGTNRSRSEGPQKTWPVSERFSINRW